MDETRFYYSTDGTDSLGPVTPSELRKLHESGAITTDSFLCREGESTWEPFDPASLPAPEPLKTLKVPTQALPGTKPVTRGLSKPDANPKLELTPKPKQEPAARIEPKPELKPRTEFKPQLEPKPKPQPEPAPVSEYEEFTSEGWETDRFRIIAWGICGFVAFDTALFLTWQRPAPHTVVSSLVSFVGEIFFVLVIPFLIAFAAPRPWRYRAQTGLTLFLALLFVGIHFVASPSHPSIASTVTPSTSAPPVTNAAPVTAVASPMTNAPSAEVETSSNSTNAASFVPPPAPETNAAPAAVTPPSTNAAPAIAAPPSTNTAPAVASVPETSTHAAPVAPAVSPAAPVPPTPPQPPAPDPAAIARDVQKVTDALADKVKASAAAEAACPNFNPATITTHENVAKRQSAITAWQTMQNDVLTYLESYDDHVRDALAHENLSPKDLDAAVADARKKAQIDQLTALWKLKIKLSGDHLARLLFLDKAWDHWSGKTGKLVFDNQDVLDDYTKLLVPLQEDVKGIADIEKQLAQ